MTKLILHADKFPWCLTELDGVELDMLRLLYFGEKDRINREPKACVIALGSIRFIHWF